MKRYKLKLTLQEDVIFTARSATIGAHRTLDYVSGAALYGAVASRLYAGLQQPVKQFKIFHAGKVRFGNGLPLGCAGEESYPMPFAWHIEKGRDYRQRQRDDLLDGKNIHSPLIGNMRENTQYKQLRDGYVTAKGCYLKPATTFRMKTAIDPVTGIAAKSQLFGYAAIEAGQQFQSWLEIDDDIDAEFEEQIIASLEGKVRLGRSRTAQYGTATCEIEEVEVPDTAPMPGAEVVLWLLSDMALRDHRGMPLLEPKPAALGLGEGKILWDKSFLRFRHYSPYNAARRRYDQERHVIEQGSVISLRLDTPPSETALRRLLSGIGEYRHCGLGRVMLDPALLSAPPTPESESCRQTGGEFKTPDTPLVAWLVTRRATNKKRMKTTAIVEELVAELGGLYASAREYAAAGTEHPGPGKTQWGRVSDLGKKSRDRESLLSGLREVVQFREDRVEDEDWITPTGDGASDTFGNWLLSHFESIDQNECCPVAAALGKPASDLVEKINRERSE